MKYIGKILPFIFILLLIVIFFNKTLTGQEMFVTPDFGTSDILHEDYSTKNIISQVIKHNQIPMWTTKIGTGFPVMDVPSGLLNPIYFLIFYLFPMPQAYSISLAMMFLWAGIFTYLYCRTLKFSEITSLIVAVSFAFSGIFTVKIVHFMVILAVSFFPMELYFTEIALRKKRLSIGILLAIPIGLQVLTGHYQIILYSLIILSLYILWRIWNIDFNNLLKAKFIAVFFLAGLLGLSIAAIQLYPSYEFTKMSNRATGVTLDDVKLFPYPFYHLVTYIWPYLLGDPRIGTYPKYNADWGIFWENTGYIGILPLLFALSAIFFLFKKKAVKFYILILVLSILLMLGFNSPTFFFYYFPPMSLFRVPAKWIIFVTFSLCILSGYGLDFVWGKLSPKIVTEKLKYLFYCIILFFVTVNLFVFGINYQLRSNASDWLKTPETATFLQKDKSYYRILSLGNEYVWNNQFVNKGWMGAVDKYKMYMIGLTPNWNAVYGIDSADLYDILATNRYFMLKMAYGNNIEVLDQDLKININETAIKLFSLLNIKYIISTFNIEYPDLDLVYKSKTQPPFFIYKNPDVMPRVYIAHDYKVITDPQEQYDYITNADFNPQNTIILEKPVKNFTPLKNNSSHAEIYRYENQNVGVTVNMSDTGLLILSDAYYPGWKAFIDGVDTEILAANVNQRAVMVPKGKHDVVFSYKSDSFELGFAITILSFITLSVIYAWLRFKE